MQVTITEEAVLRMPDMSNDEFFEFCEANSEYRIERDAKGRVSIMSGTGGRTGARNSEITFQLQAFARQHGGGKVFDSSTMFLLPSGAMRSPDAAWVALPKLLTLSETQRDRFLPVAPDFVIELMSPSDRLRDVQEKMAEWIASGCQLGWLLDPSTKTAYLYRPESQEAIQEPASLRAEGIAEGILEGFVLDLASVWNPGW